jgi:transcriptional regulator with XRE-family HTH domain
VTPREIGFVLAFLRKQRGLSQSALAKRMGIAQSYLSRMETAELPLQFPFLASWCEALDADLKISIKPRSRSQDLYQAEEEMIAWNLIVAPCDVDGCQGKVAWYCGCNRCDREPDVEESFYACAAHLSSVADKHLRIRERPVKWFSGDASTRDRWRQP